MHDYNENRHKDCLKSGLHAGFLFRLKHRVNGRLMIQRNGCSHWGNNMIIESATMKGTMHAEHGIPNQDAVMTGEAAGYEFAIVCDGVSLKSDWTFSRSELAAAVCSRSADKYLKQELRPNLTDEEMTDLIEAAFQFALTVLKDALSRAKIPFFDCQTTMIIMVYRKGRLYGGIAGDGGILYQTKAGKTSMMVTHVKTSSSVFPIGDEEQWRFFVAGSPEDPVVQALAATDGVFDSLIALEDGQPHANFEAIGELFSISSVPRKQRERWLKKAVEDIETHDDKTIALIIDSDMKKPLR